MHTPLKEMNLEALCKRPVMFDANIFMIGVEDKNNNPNCSFDNMKELYIIPLVNSFQNIIIHEMVYYELDEERRNFLNTCKNVTIVSEGSLCGVDPQYTTIFYNIAKHERVQYTRSGSKDRGEVYSLAYAAFNKINYFSSKDIMVDDIVSCIDDLHDINIITFDVIVLLAFVYYAKLNDTTHNKALKSIYKRYCEDVIKRHKLPSTLMEYVKASLVYI